MTFAQTVDSDRQGMGTTGCFTAVLKKKRRKETGRQAATQHAALAGMQAWSAFQ